MHSDNQLLYKLFSNITNEEILEKAFNTILSSDEQSVLSERLESALLIEDGLPMSDIAAATDCSALVVAKIRDMLESSDITLGDYLFPKTINQYTVFAEVYDTLTENVEYERRCDYICSILKKYNSSPEIVLDLGCGTGSITTLLAKKGYNMIGVDLSAEMLDVAHRKALEENLDILYVNQPMEDFELYGSVGLVTCLLDSLNYLTEEEQIFNTFKLVHNYLDPSGLFIFDINTKYKLKNVLAGNTFCGEGENVFYSWETTYDPEEEICEYYLNFFIKEGEKYIRKEEAHYQRAYSVSFFKKILKKCGFELLDVFDDLSFNPISKNSEKVFFVARKPTE